MELVSPFSYSNMINVGFELIQFLFASREKVRHPKPTCKTTKLQSIIRDIAYTTLCWKGIKIRTNSLIGKFILL